MKTTPLTLLAALLPLSIVLAAPPKDRREQAQGPRGYSIKQAVSDRAQLHTIAFNGLAFLTARDFGECTFIPPGKVCDYFGFQYMRDIDTGTGGHNTDFLTRIADNVFVILNDAQKNQLLALAEEQAPDIDKLARLRFPLIQAFWRLRNGDTPEGRKQLDLKVIESHAANMWELDGRLSLRRAEVFAKVLGSLDADQKAAMAKLKFGDSKTWPDQPRQRIGKGGRDAGPNDQLVKVAVMTYASEMFSWHAGSVDADVYFCPERHGTYFGGFFLKDMPVMGKRGASISTALTGDSGAAFLDTLTAVQRKTITDLIDTQRADLAEIVKTRRAISTALRTYQSGGKPDPKTVLALARTYGTLDGRIAAEYASAFATVNSTLSPEQRAKLVQIRHLEGFETRGAFLYSREIPMPEIPNTDGFFR